MPNGPTITEVPALSPRQQRWVLVGLIVQPVVAALFGFVTWPILEVTRLPPHVRFTQDTAIKVAVQLGVVGFFVVFCAALPLFLWLRTRGPITARKTLVSGALLGNLPMAFVLLLVALRALLLVAFPAPGGPPPTPTPIAVDDRLVGMILATVYPTAIGLTCAAVFWQIVGSTFAGRPADPLISNSKKRLHPAVPKIAPREFDPPPGVPFGNHEENGRNEPARSSGAVQ